MPRDKRMVVSSPESSEDEIPSRSKSKAKSSSKGKVKRETISDDEDDEEEAEVVPKAKKARTSTNNETTETNGKVKVEKNDDGESYIKLSEYRRATVRSFKGKTLIDLREMYKDKNSGEMKPGSKGISLTVEQWEILRDNTASIDKLVQATSKGKGA